MYKKIKTIFLLVSLLFVSAFSVVLFINLSMLKSAESKIHTDTIPSAKQVALVLGAKVHADGRLSDMLKDRADTAFELYQNKKVSKILVSGDHGRDTYDEVNAIKKHLLEKGVAPQDLFLDHAGFDTYDSIYRARDVFQVESLVIVTQEFHLPRALFIADQLNIDAVGVRADQQEYWGIKRAQFREIFARIKANVDVLLRAKPKFLGETIPITGDSSKSWD